MRDTIVNDELDKQTPYMDMDQCVGVDQDEQQQLKEMRETVLVK